jgi:hypothetical protein
MSTLPQFVETTRLNYNGKEFVILNLKSEIPDDDLENRLYRSAIFTPDEKRLLCVAPSKSLPTLREIQKASFEVTEIVEGTMINLFWDGDQWEIATKKRIGAENFFYKNVYGVDGEQANKSFRTMFLEALQIPDLSSIDFDKSFCYSFVLQHPCNHIVLMTEIPRLYLVSTYMLIETKCDYLTPRAHPDLDKFMARNIRLPRNYDFFTTNRVLNDERLVSHPNRFSFEDIQQLNLESIVANPENSEFIPGLMVTDLLTGVSRTKFLNPKYAAIKELRGNNPNLHFHYLMLRKNAGKVAEFLFYFPIYEKHVEHFSRHFQEFSKRIRSLYWEIYVKKTKAADTLDRRDKFFVKKLHHEVFLPMYRENKKFFITEAEVEKFLDRSDVMVPI